MRRHIWSLFLLVRNHLLRARERIFKIPVLRVKVGDEYLDMPGFHPIDPRVDRAFQSFYTSFFSDLDFARLINEYLPPLYSSIPPYFRRIHKVRPTQERILNNLTPAWRTYLSNGYLQYAQGLWQNVHRATETWEKSIGTRLLKGSVFYYWGGTALLQGELDRGFFLMHAAYEEDVETTKRDLPNTPAFKFVSLDFEATDQLFRVHLEMYADYLNQFLINYRLSKPSGMTKEEFRRNFLQGVSDTSIPFMFTHTLAKAHALRQFSPYLKRSRFASQYELNLLFDLTMVIDAALKGKIVGFWRFSDLVASLSASSGLSLAASDLKQDLNQSADIDFNKTVLDLLDQVYTLQSGRFLTRLECDIGVSYCVRNHAAHNISFSPVVWSRFEHILQSLFNVLFLSVKELYP